MGGSDRSLDITGRRGANQRAARRRGSNVASDGEANTDSDSEQSSVASFGPRSPLSTTSDTTGQYRIAKRRATTVGLSGGGGGGGSASADFLAQLAAGGRERSSSSPGTRSSVRYGRHQYPYGQRDRGGSTSSDTSGGGIQVHTPTAGKAAAARIRELVSTPASPVRC